MKAIYHTTTTAACSRRSGPDFDGSGGDPMSLEFRIANMDARDMIVAAWERVGADAHAALDRNEPIQNEEWDGLMAAQATLRSACEYLAATLWD